MSTGAMRTAIDDAIRAGTLVRQPQIKTELCLSYGLDGISHGTRHVDVPAATGVLRDPARLDDTLHGTRQPQPDAVPARGDRGVLQAEVRGLKRYPAQRSLPRAPREFALLPLAASRDIVCTDLLDRLRRQAQVFRGARRQRVQGLGRQEGLVAAPGPERHCVTIVPHVVHRTSPLPEVRARRAGFDALRVREHRPLMPHRLMLARAVPGRFRHVPDTPDVIRTTPQRRQLRAQMPQLWPQHPRRVALQVGRHLGRSHARVALDTQVDVIRPDLHGMPRERPLSRLGRHQGLQPRLARPRQDLLAVLGTEHEGICERKDGASVTCRPMVFQAKSRACCSMRFHYLPSVACLLAEA